MQKFTKESIWAQIKSVVLLLAVFMLTISITSAAYTFSPPSVSAPNGTYGVPLTTAKDAEWKWGYMSNGMNLSVLSQGNADSADPASGVYGINQALRYKEAVLTEKTLSFGDLLTTSHPSAFKKLKVPPFFEANTRESGITGGRSWTQAAGLYDSQAVGYPTTTYIDWHGWNRPDILGDTNPASSDVLELFGTKTHGLDDQINIIKISQATKNSPLPRFSVEKTIHTNDFDATDPINLATVRAGIVSAGKAILGKHVGPQPDETDSEDTDPILMDKINDHNVLNLDGHSNIGYGDTCQLFGKKAVSFGCPDGFYMVNYADDCHAKCRQMYYIDNAPAEYVNGRCSVVHGNMPDLPDYHVYPVANGVPTATEMQGCTTVVTPPPTTGSLTVTMTPAGANTAGAKWQLDGIGTSYNSGQTLTGVSAGSHFVKYNTVSGYTTPSNSNITVSAGGSTTATGTYVAIPLYDINEQNVYTYTNTPTNFVGYGGTSTTLKFTMCLSNTKTTNKTVHISMTGDAYILGTGTVFDDANVTIPAGSLCASSPLKFYCGDIGGFVPIGATCNDPTPYTLGALIPSSVNVTLNVLSSGLTVNPNFSGNL